MNEKIILHQIIDSCDDALRDVFLRRMDIAVKLTNLDDDGASIYDYDREQEVFRHVTAGLSPELVIRANSLWGTLMRMTRGRQYRYIITHKPELQLPHEKDMIDPTGLREQIVLCPESMARTVSATLGMEVQPCHSVPATVQALQGDQAEFAALIVNSFYDTEWLYNLIYRESMYINSFIPLPDSRMLALFSKKLFADTSNSIISVAFAIRMDRPGDLAQTLGALAEAKLNLEYFRVKTHDIDTDDSQNINIVFAEFSGSLSAVETRSVFFQLTNELPFFRVIGYRPSY